jgi:hypothetical protein
MSQGQGGRRVQPGVRTLKAKLKASIAEVDRLSGIVATLHPDLVAAAERVAWERIHAPLPDGWTAEVAGTDGVLLADGDEPIYAEHRPSSADRWACCTDRCYVADTLAELIEQVTA